MNGEEVNLLELGYSEDQLPSNQQELQKINEDETENPHILLDAGYGVYAAVTMIRKENEWVSEHSDYLRQFFNVTKATIAKENELVIILLEDKRKEQYRVNDSKEAMIYWQVYDRTVNLLVPADNWIYNQKNGSVTISECIRDHAYTVSFLCYQIYKNISMFNYLSCHWYTEKIVLIDPRSDEVQNHLIDLIQEWCESHKESEEVCFTSLLMNYVWFSRHIEKNQVINQENMGHDYSVSPLALNQFYQSYGYSLTAEDFIYPTKDKKLQKRRREFIEMNQKWIINIGKMLVDLIHKKGMKAYAFYDDSWIGWQPSVKRISELGFDGVQKCAFSGYEVRICASTQVPFHELRLHPYIFPRKEMDDEDKQKAIACKEARIYWNSIRRALLRQPVEKIKLSGCLNQIVSCEDYCDYVENISKEIKVIQSLHQKGKPFTFACRVGVLNCWNDISTWDISKYYNNSDFQDLIHINEALSGLPLNVEYLQYREINKSRMKKLDVLILVGSKYDAIHSGDIWSNQELIQLLTNWTAKGGVLIGVNEPTAMEGNEKYFQLADVFGIDYKTGTKIDMNDQSHDLAPFWVPKDVDLPMKKGLEIQTTSTHVRYCKDGIPLFTEKPYVKGYGIYLSGFTYTCANTKLLLNIILNYTVGLTKDQLTDNENVEYTYFPDSHIMVVVNNSEERQKVSVSNNGRMRTLLLRGFEVAYLDFT